MSNAPKDDVSFIASWLKSCQDAQPDSPIVRALTAATDGRHIDEDKLLKDLRALTVMRSTESEK